jgi:hypothetical protein
MDPDWNISRLEKVCSYWWSRYILLKVRVTVSVARVRLELKEMFLFSEQGSLVLQTDVPVPGTRSICSGYIQYGTNAVTVIRSWRFSFCSVRVVGSSLEVPVFKMTFSYSNQEIFFYSS